MSERRRAREAAQRSSEPLAPSDLDEHTVAIDRSASPDGTTEAVDRAEELEDRTVVVDREPVSGATLLQEADPEDEATAVVHRRDASLLVDDETVAADRGWLPEGTVRLGGAPVQAFSGPLAGLGQAPAARANRFAPPTGGRRAVLGPGAGATSRYTTRRVVAPAPPTAPIAQAADATRDPHAALPSVRRRARRGAIVSLISAAGALVVAVGGLAVVIPLLLAG
jgi:hypothetical protein